MPELLDLPPELLTQIAQSLTLPFKALLLLMNRRDGKADYRSLTLTCKRLHKIATPLLYQFFGNECYSWTCCWWEDHLKPFIKTILNNPNLGLHLRDFKFDHETDPRFVADKLTELLSVVDTGRGRCDTLWNLLKTYAPNLKHLEIPHGYSKTFLYNIPMNLESLTVRPLGRFSWSRQHYLDSQMYPTYPVLRIDFLAELTHSHRLKILSIQATEIESNERVLSLKPGASCIDNISLHVGRISDEVFSRIIESSKSLKAFDISQIRLTNRRFDGRIFPTMRTIVTCLNAHKDTLKKVSIRGNDWLWRAAMNVDTYSFRHYTSLQELALDVTVLLGWKSCYHQFPHLSCSQDPKTIAYMLPPSLRRLTIFMDRRYSHRNDEGFLVEIVKGLLTGLHHLVHLKNIIFDFSDRYCDYDPGEEQDDDMMSVNFYDCHSDLFDDVKELVKDEKLCVDFRH